MLSEVRFAGRSPRRRRVLPPWSSARWLGGSARIAPAALRLFSCHYEQSLCCIRLVFSGKKWPGRICQNWLFAPVTLSVRFRLAGEAIVPAEPVGGK
jgi:hypothetical protein